MGRDKSVKKWNFVKACSGTSFSKVIMASVFWASVAFDNECSPCSEQVLESLYIKMLQPYETLKLFLLLE